MAPTSSVGSLLLQSLKRMRFLCWASLLLFGAVWLRPLSSWRSSRRLALLGISRARSCSSLGGSWQQRLFLPFSAFVGSISAVVCDVAVPGHQLLDREISFVCEVLDLVRCVVLLLPGEFLRRTLSMLTWEAVLQTFGMDCMWAWKPVRAWALFVTCFVEPYALTNARGQSDARKDSV